MSVENPKFKELRIPSNWCIHRTSFYDISPEAEEKFKTNLEDDGWTIFNEELLVLQYEKNNLFIDMGWKPQFSPTGKYKARLVKETNWETLDTIYEGRSLELVTEKIEEKMMEISLINGDYREYPNNLLLKKLRPFHNWRFVKNKFFDIEPNNKLTQKQWQLFHKDLLVIEAQFNNKIRVEMGWLPEYDSSGSYQARLINENLENFLLEEFSTKNKDEIAEYLNQAMERISDLSRKREQSEHERRRQLKLQIQRNQKI